MTNAKLEVLTPHNSQLIFIDHQPQMAFGVQSMDRQTMKNNVVGLAKAAKIFDIPTTITTVESEAFSGYTYPELLDVFPGKPTLERSSMNSWDDQKVALGNIVRALKPGGILLLEGYGPKQLEYKTGGPSQLENLYTPKLLREAFGDLSELDIKEYDAEVDEGAGHTGMSALVDLVGRK